MWSKRYSCSLLLALLCALSPCAMAQTEAALAEAQALYEKAIPFMKQDRFDAALPLLWRACQLVPNNADLQYDLGVAFEGMKRDREAWQAFGKAARLKPSDVSMTIAFANSYARCGDTKRCAAMLRDLEKRLPLNAPDRARINQILGSLSQGAEKTTRMSQVVAGEPTNAQAWLVLAHGYSENGHLDQAVQTLQTCVVRFPQNADVHESLAYFLTKSGKYKEGLEQYKICLKLAPNKPDTYQRMMYCENKMGDLDGLQETRKLFVQRFPENARSKTVADELKYYDTDFQKVKQAEQSGSSQDMAVFSTLRAPIKVFVHDRLAGRTVWDGKAAADPSKVNYSLLLERAFDQWSDASHKRLSFIFVNSAENANIECEWTKEREKLHFSFAAGVTQHTTNSANEPKAMIHLLQDTDQADFLDTSLHEIGHALGLQHSSNPADIMYFSGQSRANAKTAVTLSSSDVARIRKLYD